MGFFNDIIRDSRPKPTATTTGANAGVQPGVHSTVAPQPAPQSDPAAPLSTAAGAADAAPAGFSHTPSDCGLVHQPAPPMLQRKAVHLSPSSASPAPTATPAPAPAPRPNQTQNPAANPVPRPVPGLTAPRPGAAISSTTRIVPDRSTSGVTQSLPPPHPAPITVTPPAPDPIPIAARSPFTAAPTTPSRDSSPPTDSHAPAPAHTNAPTASDAPPPPIGTIQVPPPLCSASPPALPEQAFIVSEPSPVPADTSAAIATVLPVTAVAPTAATAHGSERPASVSASVHIGQITVVVEGPANSRARGRTRIPSGPGVRQLLKEW